MNPNDRFGRLVAIEPIKMGRSWLCKCDCGNTAIIRKLALIRGYRLTCGCRQSPAYPDELKCIGCELTKSLSEFYIRKNGTVYSYKCKKCVTNDNVERVRQYRRIVIEHYGSKCDCCGESNVEFLAIDHIHGNGNKHRKDENIQNLAKWIVSKKFPDGFRLLCHNCNFSIGVFGYCPHQK